MSIVPWRSALHILPHAFPILIALGLLSLLTACSPSSTVNVIGYEIEKRLGAFPPEPVSAARGEITGRVIAPDGTPIEGATALVALRTGTPYTATTAADGMYTITNVPPGQYVSAFVAPGYAENTLADWLGFPRVLPVHIDETTQAPVATLEPYQPPPLPAPLPEAVSLDLRIEFEAEANYPPDSRARAYAFHFTHDGHVIDNLRLYLPLDLEPDERLPMLFMIYPTHSDAWQDVSVAYAAQGYAFVAVAPIEAHGLEIDAHAQDARIAFHLAKEGHLHPQIDHERIIALGGSFSSAILHRFLRNETDAVDAWVNVGGISNALTGAAEFYRGELEMPPDFEFAIPALGPANIYPLDFLRFSPVYTPHHLPPTFIVHTAADRIATIDQAYQLEAALEAAGIAVETFYYEDDSHYLMIGDDITEASMQVYEEILGYIEAQLSP